MSDYESVYDDFVRFAEGSRIDHRFEIPPGTLNADYHFDRVNFDVILELKQIYKYGKEDTVDQYFSKRLEEGKLKNFIRLSNNQIRIEPKSLSESDWNHFYKKFRPSVAGQLDKAARQLKQTANFLPVTDKPQVCGVVLLNTGDFNMSTDVAFRLVEWHMKREWKRGSYRKIDFVTCVTMDFVQEGQTPLYGRHIARRVEDENVVEAIRYLYDRWIYYVAEGYGLTVEFDPNGVVEDTAPSLSPSMRGKLQKKL
ncbi:hypothetical protein ABI_01450 [Asticcacaulis biprosthecium C19]|uniref:Uncharacterized protein n=1 Tax=Asticcacaulis biprosthecium C19 TaxID=715226 RepID=F4QI77_9CAUL|nr:hypothetical protein ABI_01450 [Asticcacaulis biprosthecium C19]